MITLVGHIFSWLLDTGTLGAFVAFIITLWKGAKPVLQANARSKQQKDLLQAIDGAVTKYATYEGLSKSDRRKAVLNDAAVYAQARGLSWVTPELISGLAESAYQAYKLTGKDNHDTVVTPAADNTPTTNTADKGA